VSWLHRARNAAAPRAEEDTRGAAQDRTGAVLNGASSIVPLIGLSGYAQTGKDTAATHLADYSFTRLAFADPLRAAALAVNPYIDGYRHRLSDIVGPNGWEAAKRTPEVRAFLQRFGVAIRDIDPDFWVNATMRRIEPGKRYVITDVRFPNEAQAIKARGGFVVRVHRPGVKAVNAHVSETALDDWDFDAHLFNDGDADKYRVRVALLLEELL